MKATALAAYPQTTLTPFRFLKCFGFGTIYYLYKEFVQFFPILFGNGNVEHLYLYLDPRIGQDQQHQINL